MRRHRNTTAGFKKRAAALTGFILIACYAQALCCGQGYVVPYMPVTANNPSVMASFFLIEKGSSNELFDVKKLQPLFRSIRLSGNERKISMPGNGAKAADTVQTHQATAKRAPVLNLHSIH